MDTEGNSLRRADTDLILNEAEINESGAGNDPELGFDEMDMNDLYQSDCSSESDEDDDSADEGPEEQNEDEPTSCDPHEVSSDDLGFITGVRIGKSTQIRRRARKWKRADVPARKTNVPSNLPSERDITSYAKRSLIAMKNAGNIEVVEAASLPREMGDMHLTIPDATTDIPSLKQGWARRPPWGKMYGACYINRYEEEVAELFRQGEENSSCKFGPAHMLEVLIEKHPTKYDLPSENEIRSEISKLTRSRKKRPREKVSSVHPHDDVDEVV
ncbi:hypothetical protein PC116_g10486 [Phytophthora cactorum]|uniref:Uncharacterized protein n=1 Tax=Phytophthora cactorum TaxID=29920 RepID=A0A8T1L1X4_9STRA|nr:hypothetical protein PC117_g8302 [Phytophthora cactorum]KAG3026251.1 hypothetical protein PC119_g7890 [Phytophthora cactorum]KAG4241572.1 hypothetical protein PC116_g10486 [Phytophthora cactorum]